MQKDIKAHNRTEDNIMMNLREMRREKMLWIQLTRIKPATGFTEQVGLAVKLQTCIWEGLCSNMDLNTGNSWFSLVPPGKHRDTFSIF
jgi:hypothetical protein